MLDYWLRMAAGAFTLIGVFYLLLMFQPDKYRVVIPWFGWLMVIEGLILLVHGVRLSLRVDLLLTCPILVVVSLLGTRAFVYNVLLIKRTQPPPPPMTQPHD